MLLPPLPLSLLLVLLPRPPLSPLMVLLPLPPLWPLQLWLPPLLVQQLLPPPGLPPQGWQLLPLSRLRER